MTEKRNQHVMTRAFRLGLTAVYREALARVGIKLSDDQIKPHLNSSATVTLTDSQLATLRAANLPDYAELSAHGNSGAITIVFKGAIEFLVHNRPTLTPEEREARKKGKGTGPNIGTKEEVEARRRERERLNAKLAELYGIQFGKPEDSDDDDDAQDEE